MADRYSDGLRMQQTGDRPMVACTQYPGDKLDIRAIHPSQCKTTKRQRMGNTPMAASTQHADFSLRAETDLYLKQAR